MGEDHSSRSQKMGLLGATSYIVGNVVGSGLFITPNDILKASGSRLDRRVDTDADLFERVEGLILEVGLLGGFLTFLEMKSSFWFRISSTRAGIDENNIVGEAKVVDPFTVDKVAFIVPVQVFHGIRAQ
ncbi:unnamed protein product, partial [Heligmosomoides polygyrus]|uniref:AA_permease domain-containing protein n=1 Tax=Heligmosomoides polygyrus TaxID=6339 RepID=A0A183GCX3_HELPZ